MSLVHLGHWDVTAIELALDLETPRLSNSPELVFSGPAEPRVCLVAAFALTSHLKRIAAAVGRAAPPHAPSRLQLAPARRRSESPAFAAISIQPMLALLRLQSRLIRAIEPGLAHDRSLLSLRRGHDMDAAAVHFVEDFIPSRMIPTFEPPCETAAFDSIAVKTAGLTIYRLGRRGLPESILAHWARPSHSRSHHLRGGP